MRYVYRCPLGHEVEIRRPAADRDRLALCPTHKIVPMRRRFVPPMVVEWAGRFGNRWAKVRDGDW